MSLDKTVPGIDQNYRNIMERIRMQPEGDRILAERALTWVFLAKAPLTIDQLRHGLAVMDLQPGDSEITENDLVPEDILYSVCAGLLIPETSDVGVDLINDPHPGWNPMPGLPKVPKDAVVVRLIHYTAMEYFRDHGMEELPMGEAEIAIACGTYLCLRRLCSLAASILEESWWHCEYFRRQIYENDGDFSEINYCQAALAKDFPLFSYIVQHWSSHAQAIQPEGCGAVLSSVRAVDQGPWPAPKSHSEDYGSVEHLNFIRTTAVPDIKRFLLHMISKAERSGQKALT